MSVERNPDCLTKDQQLIKWLL